MRSNKILKFALDIGNHSIKLLAGEMNSKCDKISIIDYVKVKSKGIKKSNIEDSEALFETIKEAVDKLSERLQSQVERVSVGIGGSGVTSSTRSVKISFPEKEITQEDIDSLVEEAKKKMFGVRTEGYFRVVYTEMYNIRVNNGGILRQAIGITGKELQADVHVIYVDDAYAEKIVEILNKVGLEIENMYLSSYVSSKGTLDEESKKMGVAHIDIGYGTTDLILLKNYKVLHAKTIPIGEMHFISDMTHMLNLPKEDAMEILRKFKEKEIDKDNTIRYGAKKVSLRDMRDIIQARTDDIINFIISTIEESGFNGYLAKGIVLTGGAVAVDGVAERISSKSGYLVRKELPIEIKGLEKAFYTEAQVVGIFLEDMEQEYRKYTGKIQGVPEEKEENIIDEEEEQRDEIDEIDEMYEILNEEKEEKRSFWEKIKELF